MIPPSGASGGCRRMPGEAAIVGGVTAAVVATSKPPSRSVLGRKPCPVPLPQQQVVVLPAYPQERVGVLRRSTATTLAVAPPLTVAPPAAVGRSNAPDANLQPLGISHVSLPAPFLEQRASVRFFAIDATCEEGRSWRVMRRYNDFRQLREQLGSGSQRLPGAPFPRKLLFDCSGDRLEKRRAQLEMWLRSVIQQPRADWIGVLRVFLQTGRQMIDRPAPAATQETEAPPELRVEIEVPSHVAAGQLLAVSLPDGQSLNFPVPKGTNGSKLQLKYHPRLQTLEVA